jgi:hypothetical protein
MATMIPSDIGEFETEGERAFYKFLEGVAKPDAHYLCWYTPDINGNEPDFLLYWEAFGCQAYTNSQALSVNNKARKKLLGHSVIDLLGVLKSLSTT